MTQPYTLHQPFLSQVLAAVQRRSGMAHAFGSLLIFAMVGDIEASAKAPANAILTTDLVSMTRNPVPTLNQSPIKTWVRART